MEYPHCPHLFDSGGVFKSCSIVANQTGGLSQRVIPAMCKYTCKLNGPYCGKKISKEQEAKFAAKIFLVDFSLEKSKFLHRILRQYDMPTTINFPESEWEKIKTTLNPFILSKQIEKIYLTGSLLIKKESHKDYDILLKISNWQHIKSLKNDLPLEINGIKCDYFFTSNDSLHDRLCSIMDCENKILYTTSWYDINIVSIPKDITVKKAEPLSIGKFIDNELSRVKFNIQQEKNPQSHQAKIEWLETKSSWKKANMFLHSISSRGMMATGLDILNINNTQGNRIDEEHYQLRKLSCFGNISQKINPCDMLFTNDKGSFCNACGCNEKSIARLDENVNNYTKLHYPNLDCPLHRKGFSNHQKIPPLSIIIPVLNDAIDLDTTISSIRNTCRHDVEIIIVDDNSYIPIILKDSQSTLIRLNERVGAGKARHIGAQQAKSPYLLFIDSHMKFVSGWLEKSLSYIIDKPKTLWCAVCVGLSENNMDMNNTAEYNGAQLKLYDEKTNHIFEGVWIDKKVGHNYEIPCVMGACYFIHKDWFFYLKGLEYNKFWGSEEPFLSLKSWLAGGEVRLLSDVRIGHKFRPQASYTTPISYVLYNKIRAIKVLLPNNLSNFLLSKIPSDDNYNMALNLINQDKDNILEEKQYYHNIFVHDMEWFYNKFSITKPV